MSFNSKWSADVDRSIINLARAHGCFNCKCRKQGASKACGKCGVAVYCDESCQRADWEAGKHGREDCHKKLCKKYRGNTSPDGENFPPPIGLWSVGYLDEDECLSGIRLRADAFLVEAKRVMEADGGRNNKLMPFSDSPDHGTFGLDANVVYKFNMPILHCSAIIPLSNQSVQRVEYVVFEPIGEGGEIVRQRLHPQVGPGDISIACRRRVIEVLKSFFCKVQDYGLSIDCFTHRRGLAWFAERDFRQNDGPVLDESNGGLAIYYSPTMASNYPSGSSSTEFPMNATLAALFAGMNS